MTSTLDYLACHDLERIFSPSHDLDRSRHSGTMDSPVGYDRRQLSTSTYHDYHPTRWIDDHLDDLYGYDSDTYLDQYFEQEALSSRRRADHGYDRSWYDYLFCLSTEG